MMVGLQNVYIYPLIRHEQKYDSVYLSVCRESRVYSTR